MSPRRPRKLLVAVCGPFFMLAATVGLSSCGSSDARHTSVVVASTEIVGAIVRDILGPETEINVIMPNGKDPHEFAPSARDIEAMTSAALVVVNGNGLEGGMTDVLRSLEALHTFALADHVPLRGNDPHLWLDPMTVRRAVPALASALAGAVGRDLSANESRFLAELDALDTTIASTIASVGDCKLVTDHDALAYFAARYGCTIVGSVVPGLSTAGEATAGDIAKLKAAIDRAGVSSVFTEANAAGDVARALATEIGARVVELNVERLPDGGGYGELMTQLADAIASGLATK